MITQMFKAFSASFLLIVGTLAMFEPAAAGEVFAVEAEAEFA